MKKTDGFTLVELMVGILCAALVSGAIITFMLMGVRTSNSVIDANADQRNAKIVITMMENLASEGSIGAVEYVGNESNPDWTIYDGPIDNGGSPILSYSVTSQSLRGRNGSVLMEGVLASSVTVDDEQPNLLTFKIKTESNEYESSVYCRLLNLGQPTKTEINIDVQTNQSFPSGIASQNNRIQFLKTLADQYGSTGQIKGNSDTYTLWYCEAETGKTGYINGWGPDTPWCATFVSWAIDQNAENLNYNSDSIPREANVDALLTKVQRYNDDPEYNVLPGDLVFFDWDCNSKIDSPDLEHVGVLLYKDLKWIYTIEGNSGGFVALRRYATDDPCIFDYGVLDWKESTTQ